MWPLNQACDPHVHACVRRAAPTCCTARPSRTSCHTTAASRPAAQQWATLRVHAARSRLHAARQSRASHGTTLLRAANHAHPRPAQSFALEVTCNQLAAEDACSANANCTFDTTLASAPGCLGACRLTSAMRVAEKCSPMLREPSCMAPACAWWSSTRLPQPRTCPTCTRAGPALPLYLGSGVK